MQKNTPSLRFPEFKDEWEEKLLGRLLLIERGASPRPIKKYITNSPDGVPWIKIGDVPKGSKYIEKTEEKITREGAKLSRTVKIGDFVLSNSMSFGRPYILKIDGSIHDGWLALRNKNNEDLNDEFLYEILGSNAVRQKFLSLAAGSAVKNLKSETVKSAKITLPNIDEQKRISEFLSKVNNWLQNLEKQKEILEVYKKGMMQKIFSQEIRFKDGNGKEFPKWEEKRWGDMGDIVGGGTPDTIRPEYWNGDINWFTPTEIGAKYINISIRQITELGLKSSSTKLLPVGTLLLTSRATIGRVSIATKESTTNQGFQSIIVNKENNNEFIYYLIINNINKFLRLANGSTFLEISGKEVRKMRNHFPTLPEQQKIAEFLTPIDKIIESKQKKIDLAENWKKGLMQRMFI